MTDYKPDAATALHDIYAYLNSDATEDQFDTWCGADSEDVTEDVLGHWGLMLKESATYLRSKGFQGDNVSAETPTAERSNFCAHCGCTLFRVFLTDNATEIRAVQCGECGKEHKTGAVRREAGNLAELDR